MNPVSPTDRKFITHFAIVIAGLHGVALVLLITAYVIYTQHPPPRPPDNSSVQERIAPVGAVYAGDTGRAAAAAAAQAQAQSAGNGAGAYGGSTDGKVVYDNLCHACHEAGIAGAPKVGDSAAWKPRIAQGEATLFTHAINGFQGQNGVMPAKGGNPALSDEQVKAAVRWMAAQVK